MKSMPPQSGSSGPNADIVSAPLNEVAYGVNFVAPEFNVVHFGEYYDQIRERYPKHKTVAPIARQTQTPDQFELPSLPRVWFERGNRLIQLQMDRFVFNWRHQADSDERYPGFDGIFPEFQEAWDNFLSFSTRAFTMPLYLEELNLTYINHTEESGKGQSPIFIFRENEWRQDFPELEFWMSQFRFPFVEDNLKLSIAARPAIQLSTQKRVTSFELTVQSIKAPDVSDREGLDQWFTAAHARVHWAFKRLIRREWLMQWGFEAE